VIGSPTAASARVVQAYNEGKYRLAFSDATLAELLDVMTIPSLRAHHGWSDDRVLQFIDTFLGGATLSQEQPIVPVHLTRDVTDTKFLALAAATDADYLVTNDRRHLLPLGRFRRTRIVTPAQFLKALA
jgi:predicted nucleic acid-binding protein